MKRIVFAFAVVAVALCGFGRFSIAGDQDFTLVNNTGVEINNLYISPSKADEWGDDVLGEDALPSGQSVKVKFAHSESECLWDFQVKDKEGNGVQWENIDLCKYEKITLHAGDGKVWATFE